MANGPTIKLTQGQARPILAMSRERAQIVEQVNAQLAEIEASFQELGRIYARVHQLSIGDGVTYQFRREKDGTVTLVARLPEPDGEKPAEDDRAESQIEVEQQAEAPVAE